MRKLILPVLMLLALAGCGGEKPDWNPVFEETRFDYLNGNIDRSQKLIEDVLSEVRQSGPDSMRNRLDEARTSLLEIKDYYLPLTTVRQQIYDAERFVKLSQVERARKLLEESKAIIAALDVKTKNANFDKVVLELNAMIDMVILTFDDDANRNTADKMKQLGAHINLMLYRGELVLSGVRFDK